MNKKELVNTKNEITSLIGMIKHDICILEILASKSLFGARVAQTDTTFLMLEKRIAKLVQVAESFIE